jgi:hypothetical protein
VGEISPHSQKLYRLEKFDSKRSFYREKNTNPREEFSEAPSNKWHKKGLPKGGLLNIWKYLLKLDLKFSSFH